MPQHTTRPAATPAAALEILLEANGVRVRVSDHGTGMRPGNATAGAGYGLAIIDRLASKVALTSGHDLGTQIDMFFR